MNYWTEPLKIDNRSFPRFLGGPLDGITDSPFRRLVREFSTNELLYTEMRHTTCIASNGPGAERALRFHQSERSLNFQIAAGNAQHIEKASEKILLAGVDFIDLNVGCPARNVIHSGCGSALMADIPRLKEILDTMRRSLPIPFTVKIRSGFKAENAVEVAKLIEGCGASAIAVHPRLQTQKFEGRPDYNIAARVKKAVSIPVLLSGNIVNWPTAKLAYEQTGVDGFLIGRGLWSRPWKLRELHEHSQGNEYHVTNEMRVQVAIKHLHYMLEHYGSHGLYAFRKYLPLYMQGAPGVAALRARLMVSESLDEVREGLLSVV